MSEENEAELRKKLIQQKMQTLKQQVDEANKKEQSIQKTPVREDIVEKMATFLQHPKVVGAPLTQKKQFLQQKGLTEEEIEMAVSRANKEIQSTPQPMVPMPSVMPPPPTMLAPPPSFPWATMALCFVAGAAASHVAEKYVIPWWNADDNKAKEQQRQQRIQQNQETHQVLTALAEGVQTLVTTNKELKTVLERNVQETERESSLRKSSANNDISREVLELRQSMRTLQAQNSDKKLFPTSVVEQPPDWLRSSSRGIPDWQLKLSSNMNLTNSNENSKDEIKLNSKDEIKSNSNENSKDEIKLNSKDEIKSNSKDEIKLNPKDEIKLNPNENSKDEIKSNSIPQKDSNSEINPSYKKLDLGTVTTLLSRGETPSDVRQINDVPLGSGPLNLTSSASSSKPWQQK